MIDLSFLTEAEQEAILKVLNRDAELKKAEDERIRHLQNVLEDENELKYKTGEWFYEAKSRRHREKIHGADLVRASIRKRKKPATIAELSQSNKDKSRKSWVNSVNKDIFIPPELCGVMEEPEEDFEDLKQTKVQSNQSSKKVSFSPAQNKENLNNGTASPAKIRRNPFNSPLEEIEADGKHQPPDNGLPKRDILSSIIKYGVKLPYPDTQEATQDSRTTAESENSIVQVPTPKPRIMSLKKVSQPPYDSSTSLKEHSINSTGRPKGILKRWSSSSSTDSETVRISQGVDSNRIIFPGSPILEYETNLSKDGIDQSLEITNEQSKQVRFAANIMEKPPSPILESFSGREIGEFRILEPVIHQNEWEDPGIASSDDSTQLEHSSFPNSADFSEDRSEEVHRHSTNVQKTSNVHPNLNVENVIGTASPKGGRTNNTERLLEGQTNVISFTSHTNNSDLEPIYAVVNKSQKQSSPDFEKEDTEMEPLVFGQEGKDKNIATGGQPLEFGKSFGGSGKIHFNATYQDQEFQTAEDVSHVRPAYPESSHTLGKDSEDKPTSDGEQGYADSTGYVPDNQSDEEQYINMAWRQPHILEKNIFKRKSSENITKDQRMLAPKPKEFQSVSQNSNVEQSIFVNRGQDGLKGTVEYSPRERKIQSPYNSLNIKSVHQAEENKPADLSTALFSRNVARPNLSSDGRDNVSTAYLKKEESPSSYNFKIMSLKDRINSGPSEQIFNPSQFHNLKSFWNVEEKKKPEEESTIEIVTGVHKKLRSGKSGIQQRNSTENDSDPLKLSSSFDSLSEEEQTSQKVASWLAQTPSAHDEQQTYASEEQLYPEEEIDENVTKSIATQKSNVGEFSRALEKLREEALLVPNVTEPKIVDINQDIKLLPQEHPDVHNVKSVKIRNSETSALANMNTVEQADNKVKSSDRFFERVMNISHGRSLNETPSTFTEPDDQLRNSFQVLDWKDQAKYDVPTVQFRHDDNADLVNSEQEYACEQPIEKECAPTNNASIAFKFGIDKLMKEYESTEPIDQPNSSIQVLDWKDQAKYDVPTVHIRHDANVDMVNSEKEYACEEPIEKECAPTNNANIAFKFGIDKLMKEYESVKMEDNSMYKTSPEEQPKEYQTKESNSHENNMIEEEVIEKTVVPAKKELCEFITALSKLEIEASQPTHIPEDSTSIEQGLPFENTRKEPNVLVEPSIIRDNDSKSYQMISHKDKTELNVRALIKSASNSSLEIETPDGEYKLIKRKSSNEDGIGFVDTKAISPVQEAIEKSVGETREEKYSLMQLQEEILPNYNKSLTTEDAEELEDQEKDGNVNVYHIPYSRMHISKKIYSDIDEQPSNHNESQVEEQIKTEETQRNKVPFEQSPEAKASIIPLKDAHKFSAARFKSPPKIAGYHQSGSYTANTGNVLYKQPETDVPELPKPDIVEMNQGKPAQVGNPSPTVSSKTDKYTIEVLKAKDESISKVLDWFHRSSETGEDETSDLDIPESKSVEKPDKSLEKHEQLLNTPRETIEEESITNMTNLKMETLVPKAVYDQVQTNADEQPQAISQASKENNKMDSSVSKYFQNIELPEVTVIGRPVITKDVNAKRQNSDLDTAKPQGFRERNYRLSSMSPPVYYTFDKVHQAKLPEKRKTQSMGFTPKNTEDAKDTNEQVNLARERATSIVKVSGREIKRDTPVLDHGSGEKKTITIKSHHIMERSLAFDQPMKAEKNNIRDVKGNSMVSEKDLSKSNVFNSDDDNDNASLVSFKKVVLDDNDQPSTIAQLKSFWEKSKGESEVVQDKKRSNAPKKVKEQSTIKHASSTPSLLMKDLDTGKRSSALEPWNKGHTFRYLSEKDQSSAPEQNSSLRSISLSEGINNNRLNELYKPSFQSLRSFWNVGNKNQANSKTQDYLLEKDEYKHIPKKSENVSKNDIQATSQNQTGQDSVVHLKKDVRIPNKLGGMGKDNEEQFGASDYIPGDEDGMNCKKVSSSRVECINSSTKLQNESKEDRDKSTETQHSNISLSHFEFPVDVAKDGRDTSNQSKVEEVIEKSKIPKSQSIIFKTELQKLHDENIETMPVLDPSLSNSEILEKRQISSEPEVLLDTKVMPIQESVTPQGYSNENEYSRNDRHHSITGQPIEIQDLSIKTPSDKAKVIPNEEPPIEKLADSSCPTNNSVSEMVQMSNVPQYEVPKETAKPPLEEFRASYSESVPQEVLVLGNEVQGSPGYFTENQNREREILPEVNETVERTVIKKNHNFSMALKKLSNEAKDPAPTQNMTFEEDYTENVSPVEKTNLSSYNNKDITENKVEKNIISNKPHFTDFDAGLQKLCNEYLDEIEPDVDENYSMDKNGPVQGIHEIPSIKTETINLKKSPLLKTSQETILPTQLTERPYSFNSLHDQISNQNAQTESPTTITDNIFVDKSFNEMYRLSSYSTAEESEQNKTPTELKSTSYRQEKVVNPMADLNLNISQPNIVKTLEVSALLPENNSNENGHEKAVMPEKQNRKEIVERIETPTVLPRTRFDYFNVGLQKLYQESFDTEPISMAEEQLNKQEIMEKSVKPTIEPRAQSHFHDRLQKLYRESIDTEPVIQEATDLHIVRLESEHEMNVNKGVFTAELKTPIIKDTKEAMQTMQGKKERAFDERDVSGSKQKKTLMQEVDEVVEKTIAPTRESFTNNLQKLKREALEEGKFVDKQKASNQIDSDPLLSKQNQIVMRGHNPLEIPPAEKLVSTEELLQECISLDNKEESKEYVCSQEHTPEGSTLQYTTRSTPIKERESSLRKSTLELYLETPYRRESSKSIDFDITGYVSSQADKPRCSEEFNPVLNALQRITVKPIYVRGVQEMSPANSNQERTKEDLDLSDQEVPTEDLQVRSQFSNPEKLKRLSQSVPAFLEETDGRETDSASESSFQIGRHRKSPSSLTNLSSSSGMASLSSVSGSVMSVYSGDFGNVDVKGNIQFAIDYVEQLREFHIFVAQCKDLAVADLRKLRSDPYVKSYLLPDKAKMGKRKTAVRKKTVNPSYNEILRYKIEKQNLLNQTLNLSVWHNDALGRNSFLGEVDLNLATWDWSNKQMNWYPLQPRTPASGIGLENRGEMKLALKYIPEVSPGTKVPVTGEVHIWIKECYQLPMLRGNKINSFVKCTILPDTSRKSRQKTRTVDRTPNPVFNHTMVYDGFRYDDLGEACVELTVWDHNRLSNHFLGGLRLGLGTGKSYGTAVDWMDSSIEESTMWESMIKAPDTWIEGLVPLRMLRMAKLTK